MGCNCRKKTPKKAVSEQPKPEEAPVPKKKEDKDKILWITCRAARPCGGNTAIKLRSIKGQGSAGFNKVTHYKCTSCGHTFAIMV